jgi:hypothetical protein
MFSRLLAALLLLCTPRVIPLFELGLSRCRWFFWSSGHTQRTGRVRVVCSWLSCYMVCVSRRWVGPWCVGLMHEQVSDRH